MKRLGGNLQEGNAPSIHLRVSPQLMLRLRRRAEKDKILLSGLVRHILRTAVRG